MKRACEAVCEVLWSIIERRLFAETSVDKQPNSRMCFICGVQNPVGLKMVIYNDLDNRQIVSTVIVPEHFQGYPGVVHGGIVATMLDEVAGRALLLDGSDDNLMVTVKLEVKYRQPTPTLTPLKVIGRVINASSSRAKVCGEIQLPDGTVTAESEAILARPPQDFRDRWEGEKQYWKVYPDA
jgi:uncharacterized protein (TIGR00369 family)